MSSMTKNIITFVRSVYDTKDLIPLHSPNFGQKDKENVCECIDTTYVSSVGKFVDRFEADIEEFTLSPRAIAAVNGTSALHVALLVAGVGRGDLVITQALTFVATCNAISYLGAEPIFLDVSKVSMGLCPEALARWLDEAAIVTGEGTVIHKESGRRIRAVVPMHTFGHPVELDGLLEVCNRWHLLLIEDSAESLGSYYKGRHTGTIGYCGVLSFNGNKIITTGGGGMVLCSNLELGVRVKHLTTTAKAPHLYEFVHDEIGFNYRMPNLNAALGCAQMERLASMLENKRALACAYKSFFESGDYQFVDEPPYATSNFWLNAVLCPDKQSRDQLLIETNKAGIMMRPIWQLMHRLPMYRHCISGDLAISEMFESRIVCLPSSATKRL